MVKENSVIREDRYKVSIDEYLHYNKNGFLIVKSLLQQSDVKQLLNWADDLFYGRISMEGLEDLPSDASIESLEKRFSRIHMIHRVNDKAEWALLHPRILDVLEALVGPDILALQSMLFINPPGRGGQGWHQDSYYIPTFPDSLIGVWMALDKATIENGCLWVVPESHHEPVYPSPDGGFVLHSDEAFEDLQQIRNASNMDDQVNTLSKVAKKYPKAIPVELEPGDVLFFHSHLLHRSNQNKTIDQFRRAYVTHYCSAHSLVPWNHGEPFDGISGNNKHILARGKSVLPYSKPIFGTKVDVQPLSQDNNYLNARMMGMEDGQMMSVQQQPAHEKDEKNE